MDGGVQPQLPSPLGQCLGCSGLGEASDPALGSGGAVSSRLHLHPAHPDDHSRFYYTLKVRGLGWVPKVCPASGQQPAEPRARLRPAPASHPSAPRSFLGHGDRSRFTSMCSWQRKQKKATSLIIKRHLRLTGKPRGPWVGPSTGPSPSSPRVAPRPR